MYLLKTVNILTTNVLLKLTMLWTTGPRLHKSANWSQTSLTTYVLKTPLYMLWLIKCYIGDQDASPGNS